MASVDYQDALDGLKLRIELGEQLPALERFIAALPLDNELRDDLWSIAWAKTEAKRIPTAGIFAPASPFPPHPAAG